MNRYGQVSGQDRRHNHDPGSKLDLNGVSFKNPSPELFSEIAENFANILGGVRNKNNKSQVRRFYDEVCRYADRLKQADDAQFEQKLPYIRMINARVAYARNRDFVDDNFFDFIRHCLNQVDSRQSLQTFRTFFEAVIGFYPKER